MPAGRTPLDILIVDDAALVLKRIREMIQELSCVRIVYSATDYNTAVAVIKENEPDIILADIHLPEKSGIELLQFVKKEYPKIKVIMVSNKVTDYYKKICVENGAHGFVDKSKEFERIPAIIESYATV